MELLLVLACVIAAIWWNNARVREVRRRDAGAFTYHAPDGYSSYVVNFTTGHLHYLWSPPNPDPADRDGNRDCELRRERNNQWLVRLTNDSWAKALQQARADESSPSPTLRQRAAESLKSLGNKPTWEEVERELVPLLESRYQTYLDVFGRSADALVRNEPPPAAVRQAVDRPKECPFCGTINAPTVQNCECGHALSEG